MGLAEARLAGGQTCVLSRRPLDELLTLAACKGRGRVRFLRQALGSALWRGAF